MRDHKVWAASEEGVLHSLRQGGGWRPSGTWRRGGYSKPRPPPESKKLPMGRVVSDEDLMDNVLPSPGWVPRECGGTLKSSPGDRFYWIQDNQTTFAVKAPQPHGAMIRDAGKMTLGPVKQERSIAGRSSKNRNLKQANHHHIKRSDLTDGGKKLSLTGKLKLLDPPWSRGDRASLSVSLLLRACI